MPEVDVPMKIEEYITVYGITTLPGMVGQLFFVKTGLDNYIWAGELIYKR